MASGRTRVATVSVVSFSLAFLKMGLCIERFSLGVFAKGCKVAVVCRPNGLELSGFLVCEQELIDRKMIACGLVSS
jgi:hypothetical protein